MAKVNASGTKGGKGEILQSNDGGMTPIGHGEIRQTVVRSANPIRQKPSNVDSSCRNSVRPP